MLTRQSLCRTYTSGLNCPPVFTSSRSSSTTQLVSSYGTKIITKAPENDVLQMNSLNGEDQQPFVKGQSHATPLQDDQCQGHEIHQCIDQGQNKGHDDQIQDCCFFQEEKSGQSSSCTTNPDTESLETSFSFLSVKKEIIQIKDPATYIWFENELSCKEKSKKLSNRFQLQPRMTEQTQVKTNYNLQATSASHDQEVYIDAKQNPCYIKYNQQWPDSSRMDDISTAKILEIQKLNWVSQYATKNQLETQHECPGPLRIQRRKI